MKLNIGAGSVPLSGYVSVDRKAGLEAYPLDAGLFPDGSCDEIRASHVLEHFSHNVVQDVLRHWTSKLKPGGVLKIAVPNFEWIAQSYLSATPINVQGCVMGGHVDDDDRHGTIFDSEVLTEALYAAGLVDVGPWSSDADDCSALPVSLNLCGTKPVQIPQGAFKVSAVMSVPRLGFMDNFHCAMSALAPLGIPLRAHSGAFWGQGLERAIEQVIAEDAPHAVLTIDYDTVFTRENVATLMRTLYLHPEVDALAPIQQGRGFGSPLMTMELPAGVTAETVPKSLFAGDLTKVKTAHFGLTLLRTTSLKSLPKPWFLGVPNADGTWGDGRTDDDIFFWRQIEKAGMKLFQANRVVVGHLELMVKWPDQSFNSIYQRASEFFTGGPPPGVWK
jgi:hypothetical protein